MVELVFRRLTALLCVLDSAIAFTTFVPTTTAVPSIGNDASSTMLEMGKIRKARKTQKVEKSRPQSFFDAIDDANGVSVKKKNLSDLATEEADDEGPQPKLNDPAEAARQARIEEAQQRVDRRPDVSTILEDEESGMKVLAQGKNVLDVVTRRAVKLSDLGPQYRLAQMFPGVPPPIREKYRFDKNTVKVPEMLEKLNDACSVRLPDGTRGIPPHPSVANRAIDFVIANRDFMGMKMKKTLGRMTMRTMASGDTEKARQYHKLWKNFETLENHISAPFRQMISDAEGRAGPQFGNLDVKSFLNGPLYERTANYLVLKGMVAHWEKKVIDADSLENKVQTKENTVTITTEGDPRRFLAEAPILFTKKECTQVCYMAQQMTKAFVETPELFNDLPPEVRFFEYATSIRGGTPMRKYMKEEFCPAEGITPEGLREGVKRLMVQLENMQVDPYADIVNLMEKLIGAMSVGTDDERDPYVEYLLSKGPNGPGTFPTYTFDQEEQSLVRFFDNNIAAAAGSGGAAKSSGGTGGLGGLFGAFGGGRDSSPPTKAKQSYKVPPARQAGRPHELGWLDQMKDPDEKLYPLGKVPPGRIIPEADDDEYNI